MTAINANTRVAFIAEVTEGLTPATPAFQVARLTGENLNVDRSLGFSNELDGLRGQKSHAILTKGGSGTVESEWSDGTFEDWLAGLLLSSWDTDVLVSGTTPQTFTMEVGFEAGVTDIYKRLTGAHFNTLAFNATAGQIATATWGVNARGADFANTAIAGATYVAPGTAEPMTGDDIANVTLSALTLDCVPSLSFEINNNLTPEYCLGSNSPSKITAGALEVTARLGAFLSANQYGMLRAYADGTEHALSFDIGTGVGAALEVSIPVMVFESLSVVSTAANGSVLIDAGLRAKQASSLSGQVIEFTRNA